MQGSMRDRSSAVRWQSPLSQAFFHACVETQLHSRRSQSNPLRGERCGPTRVPAKERDTLVCTQDREKGGER